jgi:CRP-like cAMP-binding protein
MIQISALEQSYAVDKILMILYYMMVRHSIERKPGEFWVLMKLRQSTIAGLTGLTRETVTTEMGKLKRQGVVKYDMKSFVIYKNALKDKLGEEAFLEIQFSNVPV